MTFVIERIVVYPDKHIKAELLTGETFSIDLVKAKVLSCNGHYEELNQNDMLYIRCLQCGKELPRSSRKRRKFCSDSCRIKWSSRHKSHRRTSTRGKKI